MKHLFGAILLGLALLAGPPPSLAATAPDTQALPADQPVIPLLHARWLVRDGAPPNVQAMAQTPDGWLWLASPAGLFRFDGVTFSRFRPPGVDMAVNIRRLGALPDGRVWAAPNFGGLYFIEGATVRQFGATDGLPRGIVHEIALGRDGRLWLASGVGLHVLDRGAPRWRKVDIRAMGKGGIFFVHVDAAGTVWAQGSRGNYAMRERETEFSLAAPQQGPHDVVGAPDGAVWTAVGGEPGLRRLAGGAPDQERDRLLAGVTPGDRFIIDRHGNFWFPMTTGVLRLASVAGRPQLQGFTARMGLSGDRTIVAFEDREGSIWIATQNGLDQFRPGRMREIVLPDYVGEARPLVAGTDGSLWIDHVWLRGAGAVPQPFGPPSVAETMTTQLYRDPHGTVWGGSFGAIWKLDGLRRVEIAVPEEVRRPKWLGVFALAMDAGDGLWASFGLPGKWRLGKDGWVRDGGIAALKNFPATTIVAGADRTVWFGSTGSRIAILRDGGVRKIGPAEGLEVGGVLQIVPDAAGAWLGGDEGLARFDGRRALRILGEGGERFAGASGVVAAPDGTLWVNSARGLIRIAATELRRALADPSYRVRYRRYDANDGLLGTAAPMLPAPSMVRTPGGELVISTMSGVYRFDPASDTGNRVVPPVHVTGIAAAGTTYPAAGRVELPAAPGEIRIDYTALSLAVPHRVRFQTMLEGVDAGWQDAGDRRSAFYTRLDPGTYTFRVRAANDDGVWNEQGALLRFEVPPTMIQTVWFKVSCALALTLAAFGLHRLRLRMALRRQSRLFEARVAERERIARDLHDTLLQSVQGLIMHFRRIALRTPDDAPTRPMMQEALSLATEVLEEGRDKVGELRETPDGDLAALLEAHGRRLAAQNGTAFTVAREGAPRRLHPPVHDEVLAIAREAVRNAFLHAQATNIAVSLHYGEREFMLVVRDDGSGIDGERRHGRAGHWGIPGMRERAAELGATLELDSAPGQGSAWRLQLPARLAYGRDGDRDAGHAQASHEGELQ